MYFLEGTLFIISFVYIAAVMFMRVKKDQRSESRRQNDRRVCAQVVMVERRAGTDRRQLDRRS